MKRFLCIKDVVMDGTGEKAYFKGKVYISEKDGCITNESGFIGHSWSSMVNEYFLELTPELIRQLAQTQPQPQLPVIETGVIELPKNVSLCTKLRVFADGEPVDLTKYPELRKYCKPESIKTEIDYSKIPVGTRIECFNKSDKSDSWLGYFVKQHDSSTIVIGFNVIGFNNSGVVNARYISTDHYDIQILQLPKQSNGETIQKD
jgi:hypothetical protein